MIGRLRGDLIMAEAPMVLLEVGGVGYEVSVPDSVLLQMPLPGTEVILHTRQIFREDGVTLYGFATPFQKRMFDLLLEVKGCGPKAALALLGQVGEEAVASAIVAQDAKTLARATGVGPRLAERILLELKDKVANEQFERRVAASTSRSRTPARDDLVEALLALGYRRAEAEEAAFAAREDSSEETEQVRLALKRLNRAEVVR